MSDEARRRRSARACGRRWASSYADLGVAGAEAQLHADARWVEDKTARADGRRHPVAAGRRELLAAVRDAGLAHGPGDDDAPAARRHRARRRSAPISGGDPFDVTVCGDEVPARKPDPAPYLQAMAALGVEPEELRRGRGLQVGVAAGLAAGAAVLGVPAMQALATAPGLTLRDGLGRRRAGGMLAVLAARSPAGARAEPGAGASICRAGHGSATAIRRPGPNLIRELRKIFCAQCNPLTLEGRTPGRSTLRRGPSPAPELRRSHAQGTVPRRVIRRSRHRPDRHAGGGLGRRWRVYQAQLQALNHSSASGTFRSPSTGRRRPSPST